MLIPYQVLSTWFKALEKQLLFYLVELKSTLMMLFILQNPDFNDIHWNGYYIEIMNNDSNGYLLITSVISRKKNILEKLSFYSCGLYQAISRPIKSYVVMN